MTSRGAVAGALAHGGWLVAAAAFAAYAAGARAGVGWLDSGELVAAGWTLGVSHPPGQPLHALLVRAAAFVPLGEIAFRAAVVSALAAALAVAGAASLARALIGRDDLFARGAAVIAAALVAASPLVVEQAVRAEVYAPLLALTTWGARGAVAFVRSAGGGARAAGPLAAALAFALAAALHPLVALAVALPLALALAVRARGRLAWLAPGAAALGLLGLAVNALLPLRAATERPLLLWGEPDSSGRFLDVLFARAYGHNFAGEGLADRVAGHVLLLGEGPGLALVVVGLVGLAFGAATRLRGALPLAGAVALVVLATAAQRVFHPANPDVHGYLAPALPLLGAGLAAVLWAAATAGEVALGALPPAVRRVALAVALLPVAALAAAGPTTHARGGEGDDDPLRHHDRTRARLPAGPAVFFASSDHVLFPALYERLVAGDRPDVAIANEHLARSSWFLRLIDRTLPAVRVPWLEDGGRLGRLAARLVEENAAAGLPVGGERPSVDGVAAVGARGILYRYDAAGASGAGAGAGADVSGASAGAGADVSGAGAGADVSGAGAVAGAGGAGAVAGAGGAGAVAGAGGAGAGGAASLRYTGPLGERVARHAGLLRAEWDQKRGALAEAARAAGVLDRFTPDAQRALERPAAPAPPLWRELPRLTPIFVTEPWQDELVERDLAFAAGLGPGRPPPAQATPELRLLHAWHSLLAGDAAAAEPALAVLGDDAHVATARVLAGRERLDLAEARLREVLARTPAHEGAALLLAALLGNAGRLTEAEVALRALVERRPESARGWAQLGLVLAKHGRLGEAADAWRASLARDPAQPDVRAWLEAAERQLGAQGTDGD